MEGTDCGFGGRRGGGDRRKMVGGEDWTDSNEGEDEQARKRRGRQIGSDRDDVASDSIGKQGIFNSSTHRKPPPPPCRFTHRQINSMKHGFKMKDHAAGDVLTLREKSVLLSWTNHSVTNLLSSVLCPLKPGDTMSSLLPEEVASLDGCALRRRGSAAAHCCHFSVLTALDYFAVSCQSLNIDALCLILSELL